MKKTILVLLPLAIAISAVSAPNPDNSPAPSEEPRRSEFRLGGGNAERGEAAFVAVACVQCHTVKGSKLKQPEKHRITLELAAEKRFVKRYEDIILAITNPRHVMNERYKALLQQTQPDGDVEPFMPRLTDSMTAQQMIDIVEFLDEAYAAALAGYQKSAPSSEKPLP